MRRSDFRFCYKNLYDKIWEAILMENAKRERGNKISAFKSVRGKTIILVDVVILIMMV